MCLSRSLFRADPTEVGGDCLLRLANARDWDCCLRLQETNCCSRWKKCRKSLMSLNFPPATLGQEIAAPILWAPGIFWFFLLENRHAHKIPRLGGGLQSVWIPLAMITETIGSKTIRFGNRKWESQQLIPRLCRADLGRFFLRARRTLEKCTRMSQRILAIFVCECFGLVSPGLQAPPKYHPKIPICSCGLEGMFQEHNLSLLIIFVAPAILLSQPSDTMRCKKDADVGMLVLMAESEYLCE